VRELQPKLFKRAIEIAGDAETLCQRLRVEPHALQLWMEGRATTPGWAFHALIDLILDDDLARAAQDRRRSPRPHTDAGNANAAIRDDGGSGKVV
jgi:hypothetical protein